MKQSSQGILTTHTGSLPRPNDLQQVLYAKERGTQVDQVAFETKAREAMQAVVRQQAACGIDVVNDGEMSKISYGTYVKDRLTGFEGTGRCETFSPLCCRRDRRDSPLKRPIRAMSTNGRSLRKSHCSRGKC